MSTSSTETVSCLPRSRCAKCSLHAEIEHLYQSAEMTGLSYGNICACETVAELGNETFWMSARSVDKARLSTIGQDILLVTGYDEKKCDILVSVPPRHDRRARASVDAIEHWLIYSAFPQVGAFVHAHARMQGVTAARQNYPCGTIDIAREVAARVADTPDQVARLSASSTTA